jgi:hypothetical protein
MKPVSQVDSDELASLGLPWRDRDFSFLLALLCVVRDVPGELAFALGGSFAAGSNVPLSDLDFFLYLAEQDAYVQAENLRQKLASHACVVTACPVQHYHSFGFRCSWTLRRQPVSLVEVFVTSTLDLRATAMARMNHLIIDRSLAYRGHLVASRALADDSTDEIRELILHDLVACAHRTRKAINSRSIFQAANRFYKFRMASLSVLVFADTGLLYHPLVGEKHTVELNPGVREAVQRSYRLSSIEDVVLHFENIIHLAKPGILTMSRSGQISEHRAKRIIEQLCGYVLSN